MMKTVLILDDHPESLNVLSWFLESRKFRPLKAADVETAILCCSSGPIDLFICDIQLRSALSGTDAAVLVHESCSDVPILFTSGTPIEGWTVHDFENLRSLLDCRVEFLAKPFSIEELTQKIESLIDATEALPGFLEWFTRAEKSRRLRQGWNSSGSSANLYRQR